MMPTQYSSAVILIPAQSHQAIMYHSERTAPIDQNADETQLSALDHSKPAEKDHNQRPVDKETCILRTGILITGFFVLDNAALSLQLPRLKSSNTFKGLATFKHVLSNSMKRSQ